MPSLNEFGQPIGDSLDWKPAAYPTINRLVGRYCTLERYTAAHSPELWEAVKTDKDDLKYWTYMPHNTPHSLEEFKDEVNSRLNSVYPYVVRLNSDNSVVGFLSYLRVDPSIGTIEVGWVQFGPKLQRTPASTEAQYLMMKHAFEDMGYRRYEWKCDSLNTPSRNAAARLGFQYEGTWAAALVYKGRSRDTTWLSIIDKEWPLVKASLEQWLSPNNFAEGNHQIKRLEDIRQSLSAELGLKHSRFDGDRAEGGALPIPKWT